MMVPGESQRGDWIKIHGSSLNSGGPGTWGRGQDKCQGSAQLGTGTQGCRGNIQQGWAGKSRLHVCLHVLQIS